MAEGGDAALSVLVVGGYGRFGGRIVELLEDEARLTLIVAGRSRVQAEDFCRGRGATAARLVPALFDRAGDVEAQLVALKPDVVVDASGPFQIYGDRPYRLVEACIARRITYLDLADGTDFVEGISAHDAAAAAAGIAVLSGLSTLPVLSAAAVRRLAEGLARVETIAMGIAPSPHAALGLNVIRAIASYAGKPIRLWRDGRWATGYPITETRRFTVSPPGIVPLRNILFALIDGPDLRLQVAPWPGVKAVWTGTGPVPEALHRLLIGLAWLVRLRLLPGLGGLATLIHFATARLMWGEHRGGMFVEVTGVDAAGGAVRRSWHMLAEGDDGPYIPSMPSAVLVRRILAGHRPAPGARPAMHELDLADYDAAFAGRTIVTGIRDETAVECGTIYERVLGSAFDRLAAPIRAMHAIRGTATASGRASVERGKGLLSRLAGALIGFPPAAPDVPVSVTFICTSEDEVWTRQFGVRRFTSRQSAGKGRSEHLLQEHFGPLVFAMALVVRDGNIELVLRRWSLFGIPLPMALCPRSASGETVEDGRFRFHVEISHPLTGLIVRYRGWLGAPEVPP